MPEECEHIPKISDLGSGKSFCAAGLHPHPHPLDLRFQARNVTLDRLSEFVSEILKLTYDRLGRGSFCFVILHFDPLMITIRPLLTISVAD